MPDNFAVWLFVDHPWVLVPVLFVVLLLLRKLDEPPNDSLP